MESKLHSDIMDLMKKLHGGKKKSHSKSHRKSHSKSHSKAHSKAHSKVHSKSHSKSHKKSSRGGANDKFSMAQEVRKAIIRDNSELSTKAALLMKLCFMYLKQTDYDLKKSIEQYKKDFSSGKFDSISKKAQKEMDEKKASGTGKRKSKKSKKQ